MRVLLDTCVLSEVQRRQGNPRVRARVEALDTTRTFVSVITIGELTKGVALLARGRRRDELAEWLLGIEQQYAENTLPVDTEAARIWGELSARAQAQGVQIAANDGLIAATALRHGLHVMTRNTRHFAATGVFIVDPWEE